MRRKIPILLMAFLIILIGKTEAATLTQKIGPGQIKTQVAAGQEVRLKFINKGSSTFNAWEVESGNVTLNTTNTEVSFIMPNENVVIKAKYISAYKITYNANGGSGTVASQTVTPGSTVKLQQATFTKSGYICIGWSTSSSATTAEYSSGKTITPTGDMTLYAVWGQDLPILTAVVKPGDYITYAPNKTSYTATGTGYQNQTYNPSSTTRWQVFNIDGGNVEIISTISNLTLEGRDGYCNAVNTLQNLCKEYVNSEFAIKGRSLGYNDEGLTSAQIEQYKVVPTPYYEDEGFPYEDSFYQKDTDILSANSLSPGTVWLAPRSTGANATHRSFFVKHWDYNGMGTHTLYYKHYSSGNSTSYTASKGVVPIITLKRRVATLCLFGNSVLVITISST